MSKLRTLDRGAPDALIQNHGSIAVLWARSSAAKDWVQNNVEVKQRWGDGIVVEHRYIGTIADAILDAGLTLDWS